MQLYLRDLYLGTYYCYCMFWPIWAIFRYHVYKNVKRTAACNTKKNNPRLRKLQYTSYYCISHE
jgi:hypothetical protein